MDTRNGKLYRNYTDLPEDERQFLREVTPTPKQIYRGRVGKKDPCPCGSGRKFGKCCLVKESHGALVPLR